MTKKTGQSPPLSHPSRATGKGVPAHDAVPMEHRDLIEDPVLALRGLGKDIWANEDADEYVRRQRANWR